MVNRSTVHVRRVYDEPRADDGTRVLVDRRGPADVQSRARLDEWCRTVAPSPSCEPGITTNRNDSTSSPGAISTSSPPPSELQLSSTFMILPITVR